MASSLSESSQEIDFKARIALARRDGGSASWKLFESQVAYLLWIIRENLGEDLRRKVRESDIFQDTVHAARRDLSKFRGATEKEFRCWLRGILIHQIIEHRRRLSTQKRSGNEVSIDSVPEANGSLRDKAIGPVEKSISNEEQGLIRQALERLPRVDYQVVIWTIWDKCSASEIGRRLNLSHTQVIKIRGRAFGRLTIEFRKLGLTDSQQGGQPQ